MDEYEHFQSERNELGGCSCHISAPCGWCTHPGNPRNLAESCDLVDVDKPTIDILLELVENELVRLDSVKTDLTGASAVRFSRLSNLNDALVFEKSILETIG